MDNDFFNQQQAAIERMRQMNARSAYYVKPKSEPDQKPPPKNNHISQPKNTFQGLKIPFLDSLSKDSDTALILGLLLILMSEKSDKILLFALVYILL